MGVRIAGLRRGVGVEGPDSPRRAAWSATVSLLEGLDGVGDEGSGDEDCDIVVLDDVFDEIKIGGQIRSSHPETKSISTDKHVGNTKNLFTKSQFYHFILSRPLHLY